jgi:uncharacterized membrane protein YoaK (UPF0700 family)
MTELSQKAPRLDALRTAIPLAAALCAASGAIDAIAFVRFGGVFIANMTGNTVLFSVSLATHNWGEAGLRIGIVAAFLAGSAVARLGLRHAGPARWKRGPGRPTKFVALATVFIVLCVLGAAPEPGPRRISLLVLLAFVLSLQNAAFWRIGSVRLNTSFISGDIEQLGVAIAGFRNFRRRREARLRAAVFLTTWLTYCAGAILGAFAAWHFAQRSLWIPAGLVLLAAILLLSGPQD